MFGSQLHLYVSSARYLFLLTTCKPLRDGCGTCLVFLMLFPASHNLTINPKEIHEVKEKITIFFKRENILKVWHGGQAIAIAK